MTDSEPPTPKDSGTLPIFQGTCEEAILLKADDGQTDQEIADDLEVGLVTVERVRKRCIERGIEACLERKAQENPSRPRKLDGVSEAKLVQIAPMRFLWRKPVSRRMDRL